MISINIVLAISNFGIGISIIAISIPLVLNKVPMNNIYGVRFKKSFESEDLWYRINAYGGRLLIYWSIPLLIIGFITLWLPINGNTLFITLLACAPLILLVPAVMSYLHAKKL